LSGLFGCTTSFLSSSGFLGGLSFLFVFQSLGNCFLLLLLERSFGCCLFLLFL
jgi:hypothetical protein